ncbi:MAG: TetR/AcrR family transcriptional regulator [Pseudomonadota bacterium]
MPRPSRNVDQLMIEAGHALLPQTGVRGLSIRQVTERAGVNLGMFHYHFKTKDAFVRTLLEQKYNDMFANLQTKSRSNKSALENLRASITVLARFARDNRAMLVHLLGDTLAGEVIALEFMRANMPRHLHVVIELLLRAQKEGTLRKLPISQALTFLMGAMAAPILVGGAAIHSGLVPQLIQKQLEQNVFTDAAIAERLEMALLGMAALKKTGARK